MATADDRNNDHQFDQGKTALALLRLLLERGDFHDESKKFEARNSRASLKRYPCGPEVSAQEIISPD
jgi:hypothetical protein